MTVANKIQIKTTWNLEKVQEEAVHAMVRNCGVTQNVLQQLGPDAQKKFQTAMVEMKFEHFKKLNVKTPIELIKAMAEFEVNVFGSKIVVWGDEKEASMEYEYCACFNAMQKNASACSTTAGKNQEEMAKCFNESTNMLAKQFGFSKGEVKFPTKPEEHAVITFIK